MAAPSGHTSLGHLRKPVSLPILLGTSFALGALLLGVVRLFTQTAEGNSTGFPIPWSKPVTPCSTPTPFNGCGFTYSVSAIIADYLVWTFVSLLVILVVRQILRRVRKSKFPGVGHNTV